MVSSADLVHALGDLVLAGGVGGEKVERDVGEILLRERLDPAEDQEGGEVVAGHAVVGAFDMEDTKVGDRADEGRDGEQGSEAEGYASADGPVLHVGARRFHIRLRHAARRV